MPVLIMCSNTACGELFDAPDSSVGGTVRCPACNTVQPVGRASAPTAKPAAGGTVAAAVAAPAADAPTAPSTAPKAPVEPADDATILPLRDEPPPPRRSAQVDDEIELAGEESPAAEVAQGLRIGQQMKARVVPPAKGGGAVKAVAAEPQDLELKAESEFRPAAAAKPAPAAASSLPADNPDEIKFSESLPDLVDAGGPVAVAAKLDDGVLEDTKSSATIFGLGAIGMAAGVAIGLYGFFDHPIAAIYGGAAVGWVLGFVVAFLVVLNVDKSQPGRLSCPICHNVFPPQTEACTWCGATLSEPVINPLAEQCLRAHVYARSNFLGLFWMVMLVVLSNVAVQAYVQLSGGEELAPWRPVLIGVGVLLGLLILGFMLRYYTTAVSDTLARRDRAPNAPNPFSSSTATHALAAVVVVMLYVVPMLTFPLLPMALLRSAVPGSGVSFHPAALMRMVRKHAKDFAILWLLLLLWVAGMALALSLGLVVSGFADGIAIPEGTSGIVLGLIIVAGKTAMFGTIICMFALVICRCIGMFGRFNPESLLLAGTLAGSVSHSARP